MAHTKPETKIVDEIRSWILTYNGYSIKTHGDVMATLGTPDIIGGLYVNAIINDGLSDKCTLPIPVLFAVEVKQPGKRLTDVQAYALKQWQRAGYHTGCVTSLEEFVAFINQATKDRVYAYIDAPWAKHKVHI